MTSTRRPHFAHRTLTPAEIEARRTRPTGTPAERAQRVREILSTSTFTIAPRPTRHTWRGV
ncbi:hypothetical protein [Curtobacterium sp. NPDC086286]|uniref:hypothetical protein n=1 Tax=Curtobacterium sp. NPDC086286 TaxID=3363964 RepID=UPI0038307200